MRSGRNAEQLEDYDRAIVEYTKVLRSQPDNREAHGRRSSEPSSAPRLDHFSRGRRFDVGGRLDEALVELQLAAELNPDEQDVAGRSATRCAPSCRTRWPSPVTARPDSRR